MCDFKLPLKWVLKRIDKADGYELVVMSLPKYDLASRKDQLERIVELLKRQVYVSV